MESERNFTEKSYNLKRDRLKFKWGRGFFEKTPSPFAYFRNCFHRIERICSRVQGAEYARL